MIRLSVIAVFVSVLALARADRVAAAEQGPERHWYKGNLHTHSLWSDGDDFPEMIADWYRASGYQFLALSDHNVLSEGEVWRAVAEVRKKAGDVGLEKYRKRFPDVMQVRTRGNAADGGGQEVRLQPLAKVRELLEKPGEFILIQSEEISDGYTVTRPDGKTVRLPVHMNATNIAEVIKPQGGPTAADVIRRNFQAVEAQAKRMNRPILTHLNHPNFVWGVPAEELARVVEERYFEVYNGHPLTHTLGDAAHPGTEKIWDVGNTIRITQLNAAPLMGLATDDSHHYHTPGMNRSTPGRGWVMVRASALTPDGVVDALKRGDFYASSGVTLREVAYSPATKTLSLEIEPDGDATFSTRFVGTPKGFAAGGKTPLDSPEVGKTFATVSGARPTYTLKGDELYVRAVVTSSKPPRVPSYEGQSAQAWTQPVGWEK
jgi:hypothetical protein